MKQQELPIFTAVDLAQIEKITKQAIYDQHRKGKLQCIKIRFKDHYWFVVTKKFFIPEDYLIIQKNQVLWIKFNQWTSLKKQIESSTNEV